MTTNDPFLSVISKESLEVLQHFGPEAPHKLNTFACSLEDALLETLQQQTLLRRQVQHLEAERRALQATLNDPERLIAYVTWFFSAGGIIPGGAVISRCKIPDREPHQH
ncbi:MAG: hypothetical protein WBN89_04670 [Prochlorococcaceae cyanobacterium]